MPGAYAHLTVVNLLREPARLEAIPGFPDEAISAILEYFRFLEMGAVSPDYPYLVIGDSNALKWADDMHYTNTNAVIQAGVDLLKKMDGETKRKALAWLFGYTAHVATDVTIHPIIELKVGKYAENKMAHRECEMHQDAYIFQRLNLGEVGLSKHLDSGIARCGEQGDKRRLDSDIVALWDEMLKRVHGEQYAANPPDIRFWHQAFMLVLDTIAKEGNRLVPLARHVAVGAGLTYPAASDIDKNNFIDKLKVSHSPAPDAFLTYDVIFDKAVNNVCAIWDLIASGVFTSDTRYLTQIGDWDLDTGRDPNHNLVYWS
jgi:hypothetical protein